MITITSSNSTDGQHHIYRRLRVCGWCKRACRLICGACVRAQVYANMLDMLDSGLGTVSATLKATGYWANTLLVFSAVSATPSPFFLT